MAKWRNMAAQISVHIDSDNGLLPGGGTKPLPEQMSISHGGETGWANALVSPSNMADVGSGE